FLLCLDNLEHLTDGINVLLEILENAPAVKLLLTSREKLNLPGEWALALEGLPAVAAAGSQENAVGALTLFAQRARMVQQHCSACNQVLRDIRLICQLAGGIPVGIELAPAWMQMLSCQETADSIAASVTFLDTTRRDIPERHRSLRAVFEQSWNLL